MTDGADVIPLFRGGPLRKAGGCLVLLALLAFELGAAATICWLFYQWAEARGMVSPAAPDAGVLLLIAPMAAFAIWGIDRMARAMLGISPFRILWEVMKIIP